MHPNQAAPLAETLGSDWYADPAAIESAIREGRPFNLINKQIVMKIDIFPATEDFHHSQLRRATILPIGVGQVPCPVATAEDSLLAKLGWYKDGGEVPNQQWDDILDLLRNSHSLDLDYLNLWAPRLGVTRLLEKAQAHARVE
jgi:hypothetical protein